MNSKDDAILHKLSEINTSIGRVEERVKTLEKQAETGRKSNDVINAIINRLDVKIDGLIERIDSIEERSLNANKKIEDHERRLIRIEGMIQAYKNDFETHLHETKIQSEKTRSLLWKIFTPVIGILVTAVVLGILYASMVYLPTPTNQDHIEKKIEKILDKLDNTE